MESILVAAEVSQSDKSWLNDVAPSNMPSNVVTELTSQSEMSLLKSVRLLQYVENKFDMSSTPLCQIDPITNKGASETDVRNENGQC